VITTELKKDSAKALFSARVALSMLEGETLVSAYLLAESEEFIELWHNGATYAELVEFISENY
jgi:hypothetical protein